MRGTIAALAYVTWREHMARLRRLFRNPLAIGFLVLIAAGFVVGALFGSGDAAGFVLDEATRAVIVALFAGVLLISCWSAVRTCPVRLRGADIAWLLPRPQSERVLIAWHVLQHTLRIAVFGLIGVTAGMVMTGGPPLWRPLLGVAAAMTLARGLAALVHLGALRGGGWALRGLIVIGVLPTTMVSAAEAADRAAAVPAAVRAAAAPLHGVLDAIAATFATPLEPAPGLGMAVGIAALVAIATVVLGTGYKDAAAQRTWEFEALTAAVRDGSMTGEVMAEAIGKQVRPGVASLEASLGLHGEWALAWRSLAGLRRTWRPVALVVLVATVIAGVLAVVAPQSAMVPAILLAFLVVCTPQSGMVEEAGHLAVFRNPGRPVRKAIAVDVVPIAYTSLGLLVVASPWLIVADLGATDVAAILVLTPMAIAAVVAAGAPTALADRSMPQRFVLAAISGFGVLLVLTAGAAASTTLVQHPSPGVLVAGAVTAALGWWASGTLIARRRHA